MNLKPHYFLFLLLLAIGSMGCPPKEVSKPDPPAGTYVFGGEGAESGNQLLELPDGDILIVGAAKLEGKDDYDIQLIRVNPDGTEEWTRYFGNEYNEETGVAIIATSSGYSIVAFSREDIYSSNRLIIYELDQNFEEVRQGIILASVISARNTYLSKFYSTSDGGYLAALNLEGNPLLVKIDADLQSEGLTQFDSNDYTYKTEYITQTSDGGFMLGIIGLDSNIYSNIPAIVKLDEYGEEEWTRIVDSINFFNPYNIAVYGMAEHPNGNVVMMVYDGQSGQIIVELDNAGNTLNATPLNLTAQYPYIVPLANGNIVMAGRDDFIYNYTAPGTNFALAEIDANQNIILNVNVGGSQEETINDMIVLSDGRIAAVGSTLSFGSGVSDIFLVLYNR